ncbi:MAG: lipopolysaccharide heptosyltransferase II [Candidatus Omnitrophica bacterium]|nr:lipopolysaccharide heptosyltransferase II [Candidatus Omnitrophota bacterium]
MKILILTKNWLGDILFEVPAIQAIRENFPSAKITALAPARCRDILVAFPFLDEVRIFDERSSEKSLLSKIKLISWMRGQKFDKVFLFHRSFTRAFLTWLGGVRERIGYRTPKRGWILTQAIDPPRQAVHQIDYFLILLKWAGLKVDFNAPYRFYYRPEDEGKARKLMEAQGLKKKAFVAFHVGANWEPKRWPTDHFARLSDLLSQNFSFQIVLTGSSGDEKLAQEIIQKVKTSRPISFCGQTSLGELGAFYESAAFIVSSDSGPLHIASGVGTPVVALFGPTCPKLTGPRGIGKKIVIQYVPEGYSIPWKGKKFPPEGWMEKITPEEVLERIQKEELWSRVKEQIFSSSH